MKSNPKTITFVNGELEIKSLNTGEILWKVKPNGLVVQDAIPIPDTDDYIVILDWRTAAIQYNRKNLLRITPVNKVLWVVGSPLKGEHHIMERPELEIYTEIFNIHNNIIEAYCFSGFNDQIDLNTGEILNSTFVK